MKKLIALLFLFCFATSFAQVKDSIAQAAPIPRDTVPMMEVTSGTVVQEINEDNLQLNKPTPISPIKAGLYSALLPGLGQLYNRKYWKIPIVWGAIGTGIGVVIWNNNQYQRYRKAFVASLNGQRHEFSDIPGITTEVLGRTQDQAKRQRDYAIAITAAVYVLNIVDAVIDAHLAPMRNDPDLAIAPTVVQDDLQIGTAKPGLALVFNF